MSTEEQNIETFLVLKYGGVTLAMTRWLISSDEFSEEAGEFLRAHARKMFPNLNLRPKTVDK